MKKRLDLADRDLKILYAVARYKYLTSFQLEYLYFPNSDHRTATNRLTQLANPIHNFLTRDFDYVKADLDPRTRRGQQTAVYYWTPENKKRLQLYLEHKDLAELFEDFDYLEPTDNNDPDEGLSLPYLKHEVEISAFYLALEEACSTSEEYALLFWERTSPLSKELSGKYGIVKSLTVEIAVKKGGKVETRVESRKFNPDSVFLLHHTPTATYFLSFHEHDNNRKTSPKRFNEKIEGYMAFEKQDYFPAVLAHYTGKYGLNLPKRASVKWRVVVTTLNLKGEHHRRNNLYTASLPYKKYKRLLYASITDCTADRILTPMWLRGTEFTIAKENFERLVPPTASSAIQQAHLHDILNNPATMPRVAISAD